MRIFSGLTFLCFLLWILPLGIFIKPSQEKIACDGQRAICMCHHSMGKVKSHPVEGYGLKNNSGGSEGSSASGGAGNYFLAVNLRFQNGLNTFLFDRQAALAQAEPFLRSIEPVPKA